MIILWELEEFSISERKYVLIRLGGGIKNRFIARPRDISFLSSMHIGSGANPVSYQKDTFFS